MLLLLWPCALVRRLDGARLLLAARLNEAELLFGQNWGQVFLVLSLGKERRRSVAVCVS